MRIIICQFLLLILSLSLSPQKVTLGQTDRPPSYEDAAAYEVYSTILSSLEAARASKSKNFVIRQETLKNFGAFTEADASFESCLRPKSKSAKILGTAVDGYVKANKTKWRLQNRFKLDIPYQLISSEKALLLSKNEAWSEFYKKYPGSGGYFVLSAVGFNAEKTIAIISMGRLCGELCGEGRFFVLQKIDGKWIPLDWNRENCTWVS